MRTVDLSEPWSNTSVENFTTEKRTGYRLLLQILRAQLTRNARIYVFFRVHAGLQLIQCVAQVLIFLFLGRMIGQDRLSSIMGSSNYTSYLVIGLVLLQSLDKSLIAPYVSISGAYWSARLEALMLSPVPLWWFVACDTVWYHLMTTINASLILGIGLLFGAKFDAPQNWLVVVFVFAMGLASVFGIGLVSASTFSLLNAKGNEEPVGWGVHLLQGLVAGLYFPAQLLPPWMQYLGLLLPHTYAIDSMRRLFIRSHAVAPTLVVHGWLPGEPLLINLVCLILCTIVYLPLGTWLFNRGLVKARSVGSLSRWT